MKQLFFTLFLLTVILSQGQQPISLEDITGQTFNPKSVRSVNWMKDGQYYSALSENKIVQYNVRTGEETDVLVDGTALNLEIDDYTFSDDEQQILLLTERRSVYRRSFTAVYYVYDKNTGKSQMLSSGRQAYATFSPDGSKIAFTRDNNLFYKELRSGKEVAVTTDGAINHIINGSTDWVYEEELYVTRAFEWSVDSKKIAFYKMDESNVPEYHLQKWNDGALYPDDYVYKYPKAGEPNSTVSIHVYDLTSGKLITADIGADPDIYIPKLTWTKDPNLISVERLNRLQNQLEILHVNASNGTSRVVLSDESSTYVDVTFSDLLYLENGKEFLFSSEKDGFKHFYLYNMDGSVVRQITSGPYEAVALAGLDQSAATPILYYISTEVSPLEQHLYSISLSGKSKKRLTPEAGSVYINMSPDCTYYMNYQSAAASPLKVSLFQSKRNKLIKVLEDNSELADQAKKYGFSQKEFFTLLIENGTTLNGYFLKPAHFSADKKYPVLLYQYSGPGSQNVSNSWGDGHYLWHQYLVQQGYIIAVVDTRGTGFRGADFKKITYKQLGKYETEDLISAGTWLGSLSYVDKNRIGVWGWSYGGYMSSLALLKGADVFSTAIAVAPVTTWRFYDTIYTERYLQKPQDNPSGYDDNSPIHHAEKLKGHYLLIHGTGDDNVHFQNAVTMENELIHAGKQFRSFYYPDQTHGLGKSRYHLYQMMTDFILSNL